MASKRSACKNHRSRFHAGAATRRGGRPGPLAQPVGLAPSHRAAKNWGVNEKAAVPVLVAAAFAAAVVGLPHPSHDVHGRIDCTSRRQASQLRQVLVTQAPLQNSIFRGFVGWVLG